MPSRTRTAFGAAAMSTASRLSTLDAGRTVPVSAIVCPARRTWMGGASPRRGGGGGAVRFSPRQAGQPMTLTGREGILRGW